jgi:hypothetical protein
MESNPTLVEPPAAQEEPTTYARGPASRGGDPAPEPVTSLDSQAGDDFPISAELARRLAESADGHRDGRPRFVVTNPEEPATDRLRSFESKAEALEYQAQENAKGEGTFRVFGPFQTPRDTPADATGHKIMVKKVTVELEQDGKQYVAEIEGDKYDAIFWSSSAVDKFAVPYYVSVVDVDFGAKVRADFGAPDVFMMVHLPDTVYTTTFLRRKLPADSTPSNGGSGDDPGPGLQLEMLSPRG